MRCPACDHQNAPGADECGNCRTSLTALDGPVPQGPVETTLLTDPVSILDPRPPVTVPVSAHLGQAIREMIARKVGAVLVTDPSGNLVGILTERDFLTRIARETGYEQLLVSQYMTPAPESVSPTDLLAVALAKMDLGGYRHLPVVEMGKPVGVISVRDILRHLTTVSPDG
jgi:signal-transduction protein with cAMP-binding, CBS, and nucleotidyltransferase domain